MLSIYDIEVENLKHPIGIDCLKPRFSWKLKSTLSNVFQTAYQIKVYDEHRLIKDTGKILSQQSIENVIEDFICQLMTYYIIHFIVWDNYGNKAENNTFFETGRMNVPFHAKWVEPKQIPTPSSLEGKDLSRESVASNALLGQQRDFHEFRPAQYIRIPFKIKQGMKQARVYISAHGVYRLTVNGSRLDDRVLAPENTSYYHLLQYQTYDVTDYLREGENVFGVILGDGWWIGRVGTTGDSCQYGDKLGLLFESRIVYCDGTEELVLGKQGVSSVGTIVFSDLFVGEKYDARKELNGWDLASFDDSLWKSVDECDYDMKNLVGQSSEPVRPIEIFQPQSIIITPKGETVIDVGRVVAGFVEFSIVASEGKEIKLEHCEVLDREGNYFNNILGTNKEQTDIYITKNGYQVYRPHFTYHGFRYIRVSGWQGEITCHQFKVYVLSSDTQKIGLFQTSDERVNQLQKI